MAPQAGLEPVWNKEWINISVKFFFRSKTLKVAMAPQAGLEPATYGLTVRRSTNWTIGESQIHLKSNT